MHVEPTEPRLDQVGPSCGSGAFPIVARSRSPHCDDDDGQYVIAFTICTYAHAGPSFRLLTSVYLSVPLSLARSLSLFEVLHCCSPCSLPTALLYPVYIDRPVVWNVVLCCLKLISHSTICYECSEM